MVKKILVSVAMVIFIIALTSCGTAQTNNEPLQTVEPTTETTNNTTAMNEPTTEPTAASTPTPEPTETPWIATDVEAFDYMYFNMKEYDDCSKEEADCIAISGIKDETLTDIVVPKTIDGLPVKIIADFGGRESVGVASSDGTISRGSENPARNITSVVIPDTVTEICDRAFSYCSGLTTIALPEGLTKIGESAFENCRSLTNIVIPNTVTKVGQMAFEGCSSLEEVTLSSRQTVIQKGTFYECTSLTKVNFSETIMKIEDSAFYECTSLTELKLPSQLTTIGSGAFASCDALAILWIPESANEIDADILGWWASPIVIYAPKDSYAEKWAKENGHAVVNYSPEE